MKKFCVSTFITEKLSPFQLGLHHFNPPPKASSCKGDKEVLLFVNSGRNPYSPIHLKLVFKILIVLGFNHYADCIKVTRVRNVWGLNKSYNVHIDCVEQWLNKWWIWVNFQHCMCVLVGFMGLSIEFKVVVMDQRILWCLIAIAILFVMTVIYSLCG